MRCGIEFEYLLIDLGGDAPGRVRDFGNLPFAWIAERLADKPGRDDPELATGDLGIKAGYWYLEGDERFHPDGRFRALEVKGIEIRTPPREGADAAVACLLDIEADLAAALARHGLGLAVAAFNPLRERYDFAPPLNDWERELRSTHRAYDGAEVSTLSYGPDVNLSHPDWSAAQSLDAARKLNHYAPYLVAFSLNSPFHAGAAWGGLSKRSFERARVRPAVKLFLAPAEAAAHAAESRLVHPARIAREHGRIEFKAFDAPPSAALMAACCHLLIGVCLDEELPGRSEHNDVALYQRAAQVGFDDPDIRAGAAQVLAHAQAALARAGDTAGGAALGLLERMLATRRTSAHALLDAHARGAPMYKPGGLAA